MEILHAYESTESLKDNPNNDDFVPYGVRSQSAKFSVHRQINIENSTKRKRSFCEGGVEMTDSDLINNLRFEFYETIENDR